MSSLKCTTRRVVLFVALFRVIGILAISACGTDTNSPVGSVALAVTPTSVSVAPGGAGSAGIAITREGGFTGTVTLTASNVPVGASVTFRPAVIPAGETAAIIDIAMDATAVPGSGRITISAAGTGVDTATIDLAVVVSFNGAIALSASPAALDVAVGAEDVIAEIAITRTAPFEGPVALTVTGAPARVSAMLDPTSTAGVGTTLHVRAGSGSVNGIYSLVIHGSGPGVADATAAITLTVTGGVTRGISLALKPNAVTLEAGGPSRSVDVTITRHGGFSGPITLTAASSCRFTIFCVSASIYPDGNVTGSSAILTVQAGALAGSEAVVLYGNGSSIPTATDTLHVTVVGGGLYATSR